MKILLLCGPSCSGKSTIAKILAKQLQCDISSLDKFYILGGEKFYVKHKNEQIRTFERKESYDGDAVATILKRLTDGKEVTYTRLKNMSSKEQEKVTLQPNKHLIVEGFHALNYPALREIATHTIYLDLPFLKQLQRRIARSDRPESDKTFEKIGEEEYTTNILPQKEYAELIIDAEQSPEYITQKILELL